MTTPDWATKRAWELIEMDQRNGGVSVLAGYIAQALRVERREAYERGAADMQTKAALAAAGAKLPHGYQWGADAMQNFDFGKFRAQLAIEAITPAALEEKKP